MQFLESFICNVPGLFIIEVLNMLNEALRLIRVFHNMNQKELSIKLEISRSYLSEIESGKKNINIDLLNKYSRVFDIPSSSLLLFSENLENNKLSEKTRVYVAKKVVNIMNWISESGVKYRVENN